VNIYRSLGDRIGTIEARELAQQLVSWHDAMVKHLRIVAAKRQRCDDGCPHAEAATLWSAAQCVFGDDADGLSFLRDHGERSASAPRAAQRELRV
jgi:hypothetical protein